jgi:hypothetical protein
MVVFSNESAYFRLGVNWLVTQRRDDRLACVRPMKSLALWLVHLWFCFGHYLLGEALVASLFFCSFYHSAD